MGTAVAVALWAVRRFQQPWYSCPMATHVVSDAHSDRAEVWSEVLRPEPVHGCAERYAKGLPAVPGPNIVQLKLVHSDALEDCMHTVVKT